MEATQETFNALRASTPERLLTPKETAALLGIEVLTLTDWRSRPGNRVPLAFVKVGRLIRYKAEDVADFIKRRTHSNDVVDAKKPLGKCGGGRP